MLPHHDTQASTGYTDMTGRTVRIANMPQRIVSLVPSQTELLYDLGLAETVVGITKFCIHPDEWFRNKKRVGGTKNVHLEIIDALQPDLVLANKEENTREQIEAIASKYPVWISDIATLQDALCMIKEVGRITGTGEAAGIIAKKISNRFSELKAAAVPKKVAYFIWRKPWMCAGGDTFISDLLCHAGYTNVFGHRDRYPQITAENLAEADPERILLSSEPYPFKQEHITELQKIVPHAKIVLTDGEMWSWYGSRLLQSADYIQDIVLNL